jgi:uncharacterized membrane protein YfcA
MPRDVVAKLVLFLVLMVPVVYLGVWSVGQDRATQLAVFLGFAAFSISGAIVILVRRNRDLERRLHELEQDDQA